MARVTFNNRPSPFYTTLRNEVKKYFDENNLATTGDSRLYFKTLLFLSVAFYLYIQVVFFTPVWWIALPLCALFGINAAFIGFNIMHDGCHGSYSQKDWVNNLMGLTLNLLGSNAFLWKTKHNVAHHTYTNIDGLDADITQTSLLRLAPTQALLKIHRYQHIYGIFLYALISIAWVFQGDFKKYFSHKVLNIEIKDFDTKEHIIFWLSKIFYAIIYIALPIYILGFVPYIIGFLVMNLSLGLVLALVFQLAHVVEIAEFEEANTKDLSIDHEWAIHQVNTTVNFATNNPIITFFLGGLNFQVEHHLFPKVSHVHYPKLQTIVKKVCQEYNLQYRQYPTAWQAIASHFRMLKQLGNGKVLSANS